MRVFGFSLRMLIGTFSQGDDAKGRNLETRLREPAVMRFKHLIDAHEGLCRERAIDEVDAGLRRVVR